MIVDHRTYTVRPNRVNDFLALYEEHGLPLQRHYLGEPLGYYTTYIGNVSQLVHLWQFESLEDRDRRRAAMEADPRWHAFRQKVIDTDYLLEMENKILKPAYFFKPNA
jgi:NIPSNAP.